MNKRTAVTVVAVLGLLIAAFIGGRVFAQIDLTSSSPGGSDQAPVTGNVEADPVAGVQTSGEAVSSSPAGYTPGVAVNVDESQLHLASPEGQVPSSAPTGAPGNGGSFKVEPALAFNEIFPDAVLWNNSVRYAGSTLKPRSNTVDYTATAGGGCVYASGGNPIEIWNLPVTLPNGARIEYLRMYFYDNDTGNSATGWFTKYDMYGNVVKEWNVLSVDGGNNYRDVAISPAEVLDYNNYSYVINWRAGALGSNIQLCGFRLFFFQPFNIMMPVVIKH